MKLTLTIELARTSKPSKPAAPAGPATHLGGSHVLAPQSSPRRNRRFGFGAPLTGTDDETS